jgi:hypothetical protein
MNNVKNFQIVFTAAALLIGFPERRLTPPIILQMNKQLFLRISHLLLTGSRWIF